MKYLTLYVYTILFYFLLLTINTQEICDYSFTCKESNKPCILKQKTDSSKVFNIELNTCSKTNTHYCNVYDVLISKTDNYINECEKLPSNLPSYPGGVCLVSDDCIFGTCYDGKCVNFQFNDECNAYEDCSINQTCLEHKCVPYSEVERCEDSYQCPFSKICIKNVCINAYSIEDYTKDNTEGDITDYIYIPYTDRPDMLCKSGSYYREGDRYYCGTLHNIDDTCREECKYKNQEDKIITIKENCVCGFNKDRSKHCELGNGEKKYIEFLEMKKEFINNKEYTKYCHTLERDSDDICLELRKVNRTVAFRTWVQKYNNAKIKAKEYPRLQEADDCVKTVLFGYNTNPVIPEKMSCPKVTCSEKITSCFEGYNPFNEEGNGIAIEINDKVCASNEMCSVLGSGTITMMSKVFEVQNTKGVCIKRQLANFVRYPGEDCDPLHNALCIEGSTCQENGKCSGLGEGEKCQQDIECVAGLYCSKEGNCTRQKKEGEECEVGWECLNYLGCYKNRCSRFGTVKDGNSISTDVAYFPGIDKINYYFCESGVANHDFTLCVSNDYSGETAKKVDEEGFVKCQKDEVCEYYDGKSTYSRPCVCGYNEEGTGYCELPVSQRRDKWMEKKQLMLELTNNNCHTRQRFNCYLTKTHESEKKIREIYLSTVYAHVFHKAQECAINLYIEGNYLKKRNIVIGLILAIFSIF